MSWTSSTRTELFATLDALVARLARRASATKRALDTGLAEGFGHAVEDLRPWHYADPFFQEAPPRRSTSTAGSPTFARGARAEYFDEVGFDVRPILARSDLYEKPGKCQHAFCIAWTGRAIFGAVQPASRPSAGSTLLHELGHGVYDAVVDPSLPYLLRTTPHLTTEASAMLFGRLSRSPVWLVRYAGMPPAAAAHVAPPSTPLPWPS